MREQFKADIKEPLKQVKKIMRETEAAARDQLSTIEPSSWMLYRKEQLREAFMSVKPAKLDESTLNQIIGSVVNPDANRVLMVKLDEVRRNEIKGELGTKVFGQLHAAIVGEKKIGFCDFSSINFHNISDGDYSSMLGFISPGVLEAKQKQFSELEAEIADLKSLVADIEAKKPLVNEVF
ncbi:hypothetical protein JKJ11_00995 [Vibrio sp. SCSIO 43133]|uniref:hypothetical protein n=1 Tax=Vibrio sp. SCSIO 43133 TaxID=2802577 RepID=UPI0020754921|nr:hypothetical protein [Vibrio sp. SCSIO 43133]USE00698.1 hypothetical protein JKJ11_00995 [Vibrio sp. SCSIO 43133]